MTKQKILCGAFALMLIAGSAMAMPADKKKKGQLPEGLRQEAANYTTVGYTQTAGIVSGEDINGEWQLATIGSKTVTEEDDVPYLFFDMKTGRLYANNGCNTMNGYFKLENGKLSFSHVATTLMYCADAKYESAFNAAINDESQLNTTPIYRIGADSFLTLTTTTGKPVMTLRKKNMEFLNGNWRITMADGVKIDDEEATAFFDIRELKLHGNTGCNFVNGTIYIDPQRPNAIDISNMGITRRGCPKTVQERAIMVALESAYTAAEGSTPDTAVLMDKSGKTIMTLERSNAPVEIEE
ncbi:MAG: META domain-containing protein [Muribaculaceae bacterium]|nr:META domain-containing protein [Muribaculaceae bacterium]